MSLRVLPFLRDFLSVGGEINGGLNGELFPNISFSGAFVILPLNFASLITLDVMVSTRFDSP